MKLKFVLVLLLQWTYLSHTASEGKYLYVVNKPNEMAVFQNIPQDTREVDNLSQGYPISKFDTVNEIRNEIPTYLTKQYPVLDNNQFLQTYYSNPSHNFNRKPPYKSKALQRKFLKYQKTKQYLLDKNSKLDHYDGYNSNRKLQDNLSEIPGQSNSITAWGDTSRVPKKKTYSDVSTRNLNEILKEQKTLVRMLRKLSDYDVASGALDYVPAGSKVPNEFQEGDRYDVWNSDDAQIDINTLQSNKHPPGYYNYQKLNLDPDDENDSSRRRAMGFRPLEQFTPPEKDLSINLLNKHPQEYFQYSVKGR